MWDKWIFYAWDLTVKWIGFGKNGGYIQFQWYREKKNSANKMKYRIEIAWNWRCENKEWLMFWVLPSKSQRKITRSTFLFCVLSGCCCCRCRSRCSKGGVCLLVFSHSNHVCIHDKSWLLFACFNSYEHMKKRSSLMRPHLCLRLCSS